MTCLKNIAKTLFVLLLIQNTSAQQTVCLGDDLTVCVGTNVQIQNCGGPQLPGGSGIVLDNVTNINLSDDSWSGLVNIGFTFNFYGTNYTQCVIGSNGLISFNAANAGGYCAWGLNGAGTLPNTTLAPARNAAMVCYQDINPGTGGQVFYKTIGTAPNREFYVVYANVPMFGGTECNYMSIILFEGSNNIEYHIGNKPLSNSGWNGQLAIQATQNTGGTVAHVTPGRNNSIWVANSDGKLYQPTSPANTNAYTITTIPYKTVISNNANYSWQNTNGQTFPYNNGILNVNNVQSGTIGYFLTLSGAQCQSQVGALSDTTWITGVSSSVSATSTPDICSSGQGTVTANPTSGTAPYTFNWPALGSTQQQVTGVYAGTYMVQITDGMGCSSSATVVVTDTPASYSSSSSPVSCPGGSDGTATATMTPVLGTVTYQWNDPLMQTTQTAVGLTAGTYTCVVTSSIGCSNTITVVVSEIPGMIGSFTTTSNVTCNSGNDGVLEATITQGTSPYSYTWSGSTSTTNTANDLFAGNHTLTVTDANGCVITLTEVITEPDPLKISYITPETQICPEDDILLSVTGTGGSSAYTFTWISSGVMLGTGSSITVDPDVTNTVYCVELTETCGSPKADSCTRITFPVSIPPQLTPDKYVDCRPGEFFIQNTSPNIQELATTFINFGNNTNTILYNGENTSVIYDRVGSYSLEVVNTSIYGCVYDTILIDFLTVNPEPTANFYIGGNPTTIFETTVTAHELATPDVVQWEWISPYSIPSTSNLEDPKFTFPEDVVGVYPITLIVTSFHGCTDTITLNAIVEDAILFYAPNTFTPDGDEFNQTWKLFVKGGDYHGFNLKVFNRWGEVIWETNDPSIGWDGTYNGKTVQQGMYTWKASLKHKYDDGKEEYNGTVNILR